MKTSRTKNSASRLLETVALFVALGFAGCSRDATIANRPAANTSPATIDPLAIVLAPHAGSNRVDIQIRDYQGQVRSNFNREAAIERLGWLYVAKARESFDAGFYTLAEQCGLALERNASGSHAALLLRGHALHSQHRFAEAEALARQLVSARGLAADFGLLGDVLMDVGRVPEAEQAYQSMLDLKPDPQGYARAGHVRWLKGDLEGAIEVMRMAVAGSSPRDGESAAWMHTQLARYLWQSGASAEALGCIESAIAFRTNYPPALLLHGRINLADGNVSPAVTALQTAAQLNPLPEYQWALADAMRALGDVSEAETVEREIVSRGPASDARGCALFLATRRQQPELAVQLARQELAERADVFSHDALAWALAASGEFSNAAVHMDKALQLETPEPRLWLHAGVIAFHRRQHAEAERWLRRAEEARARLLPSELSRLREVKELLGATAKAAQP